MADILNNNDSSYNWITKWITPTVLITALTIILGSVAWAATVNGFMTHTNEWNTNLDRRITHIETELSDLKIQNTRLEDRINYLVDRYIADASNKNEKK